MKKLLSTLAVATAFGFIVAGCQEDAASAGAPAPNQPQPQAHRTELKTRIRSLRERYVRSVVNRRYIVLDIDRCRASYLLTLVVVEGTGVGRGLSRVHRARTGRAYVTEAVVDVAVCCCV